MKNKTLLWVGIGSALLIGGGLFWWFKNKPKTDELIKDETIKDETVKETAKQPKDDAPTLPSTPFKNKTEGDAFRVWMSSAHPEFRYKNDTLGKSGEYNNDFMRTAYLKHGVDYSLHLMKTAIDKNKKTSTTTTATNTAFKIGDRVYAKQKLSGYKALDDDGKQISADWDKGEFSLGGKPVGGIFLAYGNFREGDFVGEVKGFDNKNGALLVYNKEYPMKDYSPLSMTYTIYRNFYVKASEVRK